MTMRLLFFVFLSTLAVSCASKKPANESIGAGDSSGENKSLVLSGDSDSGNAGGLRTIYFAYESTAITDEAKKILKMNADLLKKHPSVAIAIEGHCDERGGRQFNLALGERRAIAVKNYLVSQGIAKNRLSVISYGNERPLVEGHTEKAWGQNRRGNFVISAL